MLLEKKLFAVNVGMKKENYLKNKNQLRYRYIDETKNYFFEEIKQLELMSRKHKKVCPSLNYIDHFLI